MKSKFLAKLLLFLLYANVLNAADRYWVASSAGNWTNTSNWSTTSGGSGGASLPSTSDNVYFDGNGLGNCTIDNPNLVDIANFNILQGYTGVVNRPSGDMKLRGGFNLLGTGYTFIATPGELKIFGHITIDNPTVYQHNNGTFVIYPLGTRDVTIPSTWTVYDLKIGVLGGNYYPQLEGGTGVDVVVEGRLTYQGSRPLKINDFTIHARGNISMDNNAYPSGGNAGDYVLLIDGVGSQQMISSVLERKNALSRVTINKSSGSVVLDGFITWQREFNLLSGTLDGTNCKMVYYGSSNYSYSNNVDGRIDGSFSVGKFIIWPYNHLNYGLEMTAGTVVTVTNSMENKGTRRITIKEGTFNILGDFTNANTWASSTNWYGNGLFLIAGTGNQVLSFPSTAQRGILPTLKIEKPSGTAIFDGKITVQSSFIHNTGLGGTVDLTTNATTVILSWGQLNVSSNLSAGTGAINFYNLELSPSRNMLTSNGIIDPSSSFEVINEFKISGTKVARLNQGTINLKGNVMITNTFTSTYFAGTTTLVFDGNGDQLLDGNGINKCILPNVTINKPSGNVVVSDNPTIEGLIQFVQGHIKQPSTPNADDYLVISKNGTVSGMNDNSHVVGPVRKYGHAAFEYPVGNGNKYRPISLSTTGNNNAVYTAEYYATEQPYGNQLDGVLEEISTCEYWTLNRNAYSQTPKVSLSWNTNSCAVPTTLTDLKVAEWNGTQWNSLGNLGTTGNATTGTVEGSNGTQFIAYTLNAKSIPIVDDQEAYATLTQKLDGGYYRTSDEILRFHYEEEYSTELSSIRYKVYNMKHDVVIDAQSQPLAVFFGDNRYTLNLMDNNGQTLSKGYYVLEVMNEKNEKKYLRFHVDEISSQNPPK